MSRFPITILGSSDILENCQPLNEMNVAENSPTNKEVNYKMDFMLMMVDRPGLCSLQQRSFLTLKMTAADAVETSVTNIPGVLVDQW